MYSTFVWFSCCPCSYPNASPSWNGRGALLQEELGAPPHWHGAMAMPWEARHFSCAAFTGNAAKNCNRCRTCHHTAFETHVGRVHCAFNLHQHSCHLHHSNNSHLNLQQQRPPLNPCPRYNQSEVTNIECLCHVWLATILTMYQLKSLSHPNVPVVKSTVHIQNEKRLCRCVVEDGSSNQAAMP